MTRTVSVRQSEPVVLTCGGIRFRPLGLGHPQLGPEHDHRLLGHLTATIEGFHFGRDSALIRIHFLGRPASAHRQISRTRQGLVQDRGWSKFLDISNNWKDWKEAVVFALIMLPDLGAHTLSEKLQEIAAKDELREKLGYSESV